MSPRFLPPALAPLLLLIGAAPPDAERTFMLTQFDRIRVDGPFDVQVGTGGPVGARAIGDRRAIERVALRVDGQTLVVTTDTRGYEGWGGQRAAAPVIRVTARDLRAAVVNGGGSLAIAAMRGPRVDVTVNGAGRLDVARITADQLAGTLTGTGAMKLAGTALRARFLANGAGSIDAGALLVNDLSVVSQSAGDGRYAARFTAAVSAFGVGAVEVIGSATCRTRGPGPIRCGTGGPPAR